MADADEDVIRPSHSGAGDHDGDEDGEDETFDFRFLSSLNLTTTASGALPKRGIKDFEPHPTALQSNTLVASRQAMRDALSHTRMHVPRSHVVGVYDAATGLTRVNKIKGQMFRNIGKDVSGGGVDLFPEEALWALERGSLDVRWSKAHDGEDEEGLPMSLQGAYAAFIGEEEEGRGKLTVEKYQVYSGLKRVGYTVLRAEEWDDHHTQSQEIVEAGISVTNTSLFAWLYTLVVRKAAISNTLQQQTGPLVKPGLYRNYNDIYKFLHVIPAYNPAVKSVSTSAFAAHSTTPTNEHSASPFHTTWNVYKSNLAFRKSAPPPPSFRICVVSARDTFAPTLLELSDLFSEQKYDPPTPAGKNGQTGGVGAMYGRLKHGHKNVIIAVVDEGIVSYMSWADAGFCGERLYERETGGARGKGRDGRGRGGSRGRGRGRGG